MPGLAAGASSMFLLGCDARVASPMLYMGKSTVEAGRTTPSNMANARSLGAVLCGETTHQASPTSHERMDVRATKVATTKSFTQPDSARRFAATTSAAELVNSSHSVLGGRGRA